MAGRWPFVGRVRELTRARTLLDSGVGVLVGGEPGIGKTAFARQLSRGAPALHVIGQAVSTHAPFEAFGALLGAAPARGTLGVSDVATLLAAALTEQGRSRSLIVVDDVQLLDDPSAQVLLQLAASDVALVVGTSPSGSTLPAAVERLWRDGLCERIELAPLGGTEVTELLDVVVGGTVDENASHAFAERSGGNPLVLRELVTAALDASRLVPGAAGTWTLTGDPPISRGLRDVVAARLVGVPEAHRAALELIAAGEPIALPIASDLLGDELLDDLGAAGLIAVRDGLAGPEVSTAHPTYGDALRTELSALRLHRLRLALARRLEAAAHPTPHDLVRAALWRLDSGQVDDPDRLLTAARAARSLSLATAERLARRARELSGSVAATLLLAEILTHSGRSAMAAALTAALPPETLAPPEREAIVYCAAVGAGLLAGNPGGGADLVAATIAGDPAASDQLRALHSSLLAFDARFPASLEIGTPIVDDPVAHPAARTLAAIGVVGSLFWLGRHTEAVATADRIAPVATNARDAVPFGAASVELLTICGLLERGDLDGAEERARRMRQRADDEQDGFAGPRADYGLARVLLLRGQVASAQRLFARCRAGAGPFDQFMTRHLGGMLAQAAAMRGDLATARTALAESADGTRMKTYEPEYELAEAAVLAASLQLAAAAERAAWAAGVAADQNEWSLALAAYHDAARYGDRQVLVPMRDAAARVDGTLAWCYLDHASALAARDPVALEEVARRFEAQGVLLFAAEANEAAALAHARAGHLRAARAAGSHAAGLRAACEDAVSPWLAGAVTAAPLTERERQVAALAAAGSPDAAIAARLGISIRTVQTHLGHVYDKLGSAGRTDLATRLSDPLLADSQQRG
ncbi:MAG TPA: LuxR C-terminal-related transcriptional regulator [Jatrophihabitans sp.]|nr:LuxR C-terminal-related transcriptional regulator [Jatrophihabitans sp.]